MDNFDLKKYLAENKLTTNSRLSEKLTPEKQERLNLLRSQLSSALDPTNYENEIDALNTMASCQEIIIANSSYSWWGSYLANSKKTVSPSDWFGDELKRTKDIKDLYRKGWEII